MISIFLGGTVLAFVLATEGHLTLHASAIVVNQQALAIAGPSGWGKSTIAALMCGAGASLLTDDALRVDLGRSGVVCYPGTKTIRLRAGAAAISGNVAGANIGETADGRAGLVPPRLAYGDVPLVAVLLPTPARGAKGFALRRLGGMDSVWELLPQARFGWSFLPGGDSKLFDLTAELVGAVPVYEATVPWGPPFAPTLVEELLDAVGLGERSSRDGRARSPDS